MSNIRPYVIINGVDSRTITGLLITSLPPISKPAQRTLTETIDGRDGDSSVKLGYSAYDKSLGIALTFGYNVDDVISFFNSEGTIVFSNEPDKLYNFEIFEAIDFEKLIRFKTATVTIHTQPFKFSTTENPLEFTSKEFTVVNNGNTDSRPNLVITGKGLATMQINGKNALNIDFGDAEQTLLIDSEGMNAYYTNNIKSIEAEINATGGNGTPDSPIPINGYTEANITRCGVNVWDEETELGILNSDGTVSPSTTRLVTKNFIPIVGGITYAFVFNTSLGRGRAAWYDANKTIIEYIGDFPTTTAIEDRYSLETAPANACYFKWCFTTAYGTTYRNDTSICYPTSETYYHPYTGNTYTIAFGQTVYGGVLDVTRGKLRVTSQYITIPLTMITTVVRENNLWRVTTNQAFYDVNNDYKIGLCNSLTFKSSYVDVNSNNNSVAFNNAYGLQLILRNDAITTEADAKTFVTTLEFCYPLATPFDIDLTPEVISAVVGTNNVYSNTGNVTVIFVNDGQDETQTGAIVSFDLDESDLNKGDLANRLVSGNYANIRLKTGSNAINFIGSVSAVGLDKYSRWL